jgi:DNA-binding transcriptional LysR family regulator
VRFDLVDLRLFTHVAEAQSITGGAERSNLALASASGRVRAMEERLGVLLFHRGRRGVVLTAAGERLLDHARLIVQQAERLQGDIGSYARGLMGRVRVLSNTAAFSEHLPRALAPFLAANPGVDIELEEKGSADIGQAIASGTADIGIASQAALPEILQTFPFRVDRLVLVVARADPLARRRSMAFAEVARREFVGLPRESALQRHVTAHAAQLGAAMKVRMRVSGFDAICRMAEAQIGVGVVPETAAQRCRRSMGIAMVRLRDPWAERHLTVCVRDLGALPAPARRLVAHLRRDAAP